jgi:hypothetical protein
MDQGQLLRRRMAAAPKIIAPRPIGDSSLLTQIRRYKASRPRPVAPTTTDCCVVRSGKRSDGQSQVWTAEAAVSAAAGCAVCASPAPQTVVIPCCPPEPIPEQPNGAFPKPLAYQGKDTCCGVVGGAPHPSSPKKCCTPGNTNTWWANDIPCGYVAPVSVCSCRCPPPCPPIRRCCDPYGNLVVDNGCMSCGTYI